MRESHWSGSFDRIVCGVQSYDWPENPAWHKTLRPVGSYSVRWALVLKILSAFLTIFKIFEMTGSGVETMLYTHAL